MILTVTLNPTIDKAYVVDRLVPGDVIRVKETRQTAAGKGIQVSKVARLLGEDTTATGFLGGHSGDYINQFLTDAGVETDFLPVSADTRTCINVDDLSTGRITELLEPGAMVSREKQEDFLLHFSKLVKSCGIAVVSGSVPAGIDENYYPELVRIAKEAGKKIILDTSGKLLAKGIDSCPTVIKPNRQELMELLGREIHTQDEIIEAAQEIRKRGIEMVVVSLGKDGAMFVTEDEVYWGTTPDIKIVNTVACGDSMVAGIAVGMVRNYPLKETIRLAMAVSTANALRKETGFFLKEDLFQLLTTCDAIKLR